MLWVFYQNFSISFNRKRKKEDECWYNNYHESAHDYRLGKSDESKIPSRNEKYYKEIRRIEKHQVRGYINATRNNKK